MTDRLDEIRKRNVAALDMVTALCKPKGAEGARDWIMSIPARPGYDPDLVISESLCDIAYLLAEVTRQRKILQECGEYFEERADAEYLPGQSAAVANIEMQLLCAIHGDT